jgi:hypothetical protein
LRGVPHSCTLPQRIKGNERGSRLANHGLTGNEKKPDVRHILSKVAQDHDNGIAHVDRIVIHRATDREYTYRVFPVGPGEYSGGVVTLRP